MPKQKQGLETETKVEETESAFKPGIAEPLPGPEPPPQPEVKPPTAEEQLATLQEQLKDIQTKYERADKEARSAQAAVTQKDRLLKESSDVRSEMETLKNMVKILATQSPRGIDEDADDLEATAKQKRPDIDIKFKELEERERARRYQEQIQQTVLEYQKRVEQLGLTEDDENYWEIYRLVTNATPADFRIADIKLKKLEKEGKQPVDKKPADNKDKELAELKKQLDKLQKQISGELDSETGLPTGSPANEEQIRKNFRENSTNPAARKAYLELMASKRG